MWGSGTMEFQKEWNDRSGLRNCVTSTALRVTVNSVPHNLWYATLHFVEDVDSMIEVHATCPGMQLQFCHNSRIHKNHFHGSFYFFLYMQRGAYVTTHNLPRQLRIPFPGMLQSSRSRSVLSSSQLCTYIVPVSPPRIYGCRNLCRCGNRIFYPNREQQVWCICIFATWLCRLTRVSHVLNWWEPWCKYDSIALMCMC